MRRRKPPRQLEQIREEPAEGLAARWGGVADDYLALIDFFDKSYEFAPENPAAAAMITHNSFGIFLAEELPGTVIPLTETNDSRQFPQIISTRSAAEDLVYARIGSIPPAGNLAARTKVRLSQKTASDIGGLPALDHQNKRTTFYLPDFLPREDETGILFLDELPGADEQTRIAAYGLILERRVADWTLGDRWRIIAAGNRPEDGAISCDLGTAMNDRLVHLVIEPTAQDWLAVD